MQEWQRLPDGLLGEVIEARAYEATKIACDRAASRAERPQTALAGLVQEIEFALAAEEIERGR